MVTGSAGDHLLGGPGADPSALRAVLRVAHGVEGVLERGVQRADKCGELVAAHVVHEHVVRGLGDGRGLRALTAPEGVLDGLVDRERGGAEDRRTDGWRQAGAEGEPGRSPGGRGEGREQGVHRDALPVEDDPAALGRGGRVAAFAVDGDDFGAEGDGAGSDGSRAESNRTAGELHDDLQGWRACSLDTARRYRKQVYALRRICRSAPRGQDRRGQRPSAGRWRRRGWSRPACTCTEPPHPTETGSAGVRRHRSLRRVGLSCRRS